MKFCYRAPNEVGPFVLGASLSPELPSAVVRKISSTHYESANGIQPYTVFVDGEEAAILDVKMGVIDAITALSSFIVGKIEMIGADIAVFERAIGEKYRVATPVRHDDGSTVQYLDYIENRFIVTTEDNVITSVCLYNQ